jgi:ubiquinone/menaquinone biosynthesis C-methylase UbiE
VAESWIVDELAHAGTEHLDPDLVAGYDRKQGWPDPSPDLAVLAAHGVGPSSTVIDLGAGTGRFALAAARVYRRVVAVDVSPAMLASLHSRQSTVECVRAGFLSYQHTGPAADAVYTRNALHQLPDFFKALALHRIAGLLRPGGVLRLRDLVFDCTPGEVPAVLADWFAGAVADPAVGYTAADFAEHVRCEHSTYRWLLEPMLDAAGFDVVSAEYGRRVYATYTCLRRP